MKLIAKLLIFIIMFSMPYHSQALVVGYSREFTSTSYTCVGWASSNCVPTGTASSSTDATADRLYSTTWSATENGTAVSIQFETGAAFNCTAAWVVLYRDTTLLGKGVISGMPLSADTWYEVTLVEESSGSLDFTTSDDLYFGVGIDYGSTTVNVGREDSGGTNLYFTSDSLTSGPPSTCTNWSSSGGRDNAFILKYE